MAQLSLAVLRPLAGQPLAARPPVPGPGPPEPGPGQPAVRREARQVPRQVPCRFPKGHEEQWWQLHSQDANLRLRFACIGGNDRFFTVVFVLTFYKYEDVTIVGCLMFADFVPSLLPPKVPHFGSAEALSLIRLP